MYIQNLTIRFTQSGTCIASAYVQDVIDGVDSGALVWFMAHVQVTRYGIALSDEYLGGCCYKSYSDFISDGYYSDMVEQAINEAKAKIAELMKEFS